MICVAGMVGLTLGRQEAGTSQRAVAFSQPRSSESAQAHFSVMPTSPGIPPGKSMIWNLILYPTAEAEGPRTCTASSSILQAHPSESMLFLYLDAELLKVGAGLGLTGKRVS
jgi:hypothetical protein